MYTGIQERTSLLEGTRGEMRVYITTAHRVVESPQKKMLSPSNARCGISLLTRQPGWVSPRRQSLEQRQLGAVLFWRPEDESSSPCAILSEPP